MGGRLLAMAVLSMAAEVPGWGQTERAPAERHVVMDAGGVLRWEDDSSEVALFGVNYYPPFCIDYASLKALGADLELTIRQDVAHFARLGLDSIRLHVFDREISDEQGNLLDNEHLQLLDYLLAECKRRGIYAMLTPIAWWQCPGQTHGFSDVYPMAEMIVNPEAITAQRNYLRQFLTHRNRYTGLTFAEDPAITVLELINEPIPAQSTPDEAVVAYINQLCAAVREAGCTKPIFYNGWGGRLGAVGRSDANGCTFGMYPTGLASGHGLTQDFLARVDDYPEMRDPALGAKAKAVYEFDAADVPGSYMYPAMARAFRSGGAQLAHQFQYDPWPTAASNADWQTHYLNLLYAPHRAVSFAIASEVFHRLPRLQTYGRHPDSDRFGPFRVSYQEQLSEMATAEAFLYSNDTSTEPPAPAELRRIVGCGSSPVVQYEGTGAYFLDRVGDGAWRLEVYPDDVWVADPFGRTSLDRETSRLYFRERGLTVRLPDLGARLRAESLTGKGSPQEAREGRLTVTPGVYLLLREGAARPAEVSREFVVPEPRELPSVVWHDPAIGVLEGEELPIRATVAALAPESVRLYLGSSEAAPEVSELRQVGPYQFEGAIPAERVRRGTLTYCVSVTEGREERVFPAPETGAAAGRFVAREPATLIEFAEADPVPPVEFGADVGAAVKLVPGSGPGRVALAVTADHFGPPPSACGVKPAAKATGERLRAYNTLRVRARRTQPHTAAVEVGLIEEDGAAHGYDVPLSTTFTDYRVPLRDMRPLWGTTGAVVHPERVVRLSFAFGSWLFPQDAAEAHGIEVESVALEYVPEAYRVPVHSRQDPVTLYSADQWMPVMQTQVPYQQTLVAGMEPGSSARRLAVAGFEREGNCTSVRVDLSRIIELWRPVIAGHEALHVRARGGEPTTNALEVVLTELDGTPWGANVPLTTEWQDVQLPVRELRHFAHWGGTPQGRGGPDDYCHVDNLATLSLTYGAWLYPEHISEPHAIEVEFVRLGQ